MLHVTNGSSVSLDALTWDDVLHEGPVPAGLHLAELSRVRAEYLSQPPTCFDRRDATLLGATEIVLWFEHDLYDQLQLIQILDALAGRDVDVQLIQTDTYLGRMMPEQLADLYPTRKPVTSEQFQIAVRAWRVFRSPSPRAMEDLLTWDLSALPFLAPALRRLLQQYPWTGTGVNRTEHQILDAVNRGVRDRVAMFVDQSRQEDPIFLGDVSYFRFCDDLTQGDNPLLSETGGVYALTDAGRDVLNGRADRVHINGVDRWIGGVHLHGRRCWRWDPVNARMVEA